MSVHVGLPVRLACYVAGGAVLSAAGPALWNVPAVIGIAACAAAAACFMIVDVLCSTYRMARRAVVMAAYQRAAVEALGARVAALEALQQPVRQTIPNIAPELNDAARETTNNLLQFAAHVSARCGRQAAFREPEHVSSDAQDGTETQHGIEGAEVELHLQPIVGMSDRRVVHYEALTRLRARSGALMMPAEFLPAIRAAGQTADLDRRQLASIVDLCNRIGDRHPETRLFCNLSGDSLRNEGFRAALTAFAREHRSLSRRIAFEIDAATAVALNTEAVADLRGIEAMGFAFSVDKTALGDLPHLQSVFRRLAFLKFDAVTLADADQTVLKALVRGGTQVIATHVETEQQAQSARRPGVEFGQGFLFGKPRPARMDDNSRRRAA